MKRNYKAISLLLVTFIVILIAITVWRSFGQSASSPNFVSTPAQDQYTQAFRTYIAQLEQEGFITAKEIRVEGSEPFIFVHRPQNSNEIRNEDLQSVADLILHTVSVFESSGGLRHDDIDIAFHRPAEQKIILIKRRAMPELLSADVYGELTVAIDKSYFTSLINLAGAPKNNRQDFANAWSVIQAVCLGYSGSFMDNDPVCNIISANAAAGWVGMDRAQATEIINSYGSTQLGYLGSKDYRYRFISFVYEEFVGNNHP